MTSKRAEYLRFAQLAEQEEAKATNSEARIAWERIVVGYLELADIAELGD